MTMTHETPRMHNRPDDPAFSLLQDDFVSTPKVHRAGCYICEDMEFARMGLPLCMPCCVCSAKANCTAGHIPADDNQCDDCGHQVCQQCSVVPAQAEICTCATPCCEVDIGVGIQTCGSYHCPTHRHSEK